MGNEFNYSICVLIVLLMFFWFVCKCIGPHQCTHNTDPKKEFFYSFNDTNAVQFSDTPIPYIRYDNKTNKLKIPNSMTAYTNLFDKDMIKCGIDTNNDENLSLMHMQKKKNETANSRPKSITSTRNNQINDRVDRLPMANF